MKKNLFYAMAIAAAFTACSEDNEVIVNDNVQGEISGDAYIALSINLPTQNSTRTNDGHATLNDGMESEYKVKNAKVLFFDGTDKNSKYVFTKNLTLGWSDNDNEHITQTSTQVVMEIAENIETTYGMLVVLNDNESTLFSLTSGTTTLENVLAMESSDIAKDVTNGLLMTNAPLAKEIGNTEWNSTIQLLVPVGAVYSTEAEAKVGAATQVYVERAVAKVTMNQTATTSNLENGKIDETAIPYTITGWNLGNTNPTSYLLRNTFTEDYADNDDAGKGAWGKLKSNSTAVSSTATFRFIGNTPVANSLYRTYFAQDPNYSEDGDLTNASNVVTEFGETKPLYCYENTFDVEHMTQKNTTHVVIEAQLGTKTGESYPDLYVINDVKSIVYDDVEDIKKLVYNAIGETTLKTGWNGTDELSLSDFTIEFEDVAYSPTADYPSVNLKVKSITVATESKYTDKDAANNALTAKVVDVNAAVRISKYANGKSYYAARIKHFGDSETPWNNGESVLPSAGNVYPKTPSITYPNYDAIRDGNYLGRYGVLRNNWYDLTVSKISMIGEPSIEIIEGEEDDTDTDDEMDSYITLQINILSWAKRSQEVEL